MQRRLQVIGATLIPTATTVYAEPLPQPVSINEIPVTQTMQAPALDTSISTNTSTASLLPAPGSSLSLVPQPTAMVSTASPDTQPMQAATVTIISKAKQALDAAVTAIQNAWDYANLTSENVNGSDALKVLGGTVNAITYAIADGLTAAKALDSIPTDPTVAQVNDLITYLNKVVSLTNSDISHLTTIAKSLVVYGANAVAAMNVLPMISKTQDLTNLAIAACQNVITQINTSSGYAGFKSPVIQNPIDQTSSSNAGAGAAPSSSWWDQPSIIPGVSNEGAVIGGLFAAAALGLGIFAYNKKSPRR